LQKLLIQLVAFSLISTQIQIILTSRLRLKETVLGVFDFAEIIAGAPKNKNIGFFCEIFC
jgi:hypothetical protein